MYFQRTDRGISIHNVEDRPEWAADLLDTTDHDTGLTVDDDVITFAGLNGTYRWRITGRRDMGQGHAIVTSELIP